MKIFDPKLTGSIEIQSQVSGSIIPTTTEVFDLGSSTNRWNDIYLAGSTIDLGGTKMTKDADGNVEFKDGSNNRKKVIVEEILVGSGNNQKRIKVDDGKLSMTNKDGNAGTQMFGHILPHGHNLYDLGSTTAQWRDLYLSSGSLYIDGTQVLSSDSNILTVTTDTGQSLKLLETGADDITLQTDTGNIELKGTVEILSGKKIIDSAGTVIQFGDSLGVTGSISVSGTVDGIDLQAMSSSLASRISSLDNEYATDAELNAVSASVKTFATNADTTLSSSLAADIKTNDGRLDTLEGKTLISQSAQIASDISGSITSYSASVATRFEGLTTNYNELDNIPANIVSASAQIASDISGSNTAFSASVASRFEGLTTNYNELDNIPANIVSGSTQIRDFGAVMDSEVTDLSLVKGLTDTKISGSFTATSASLATNIATNTSNISTNASSITSLNAATSSYLLNTTDTLTGNLTVTGTLTAQQFNTEYVSASILFDSGSTKFGDSSDDVHNFTGSVYIQGNYLNVIHPSPTIQLQDTSDDDDQKIRFLNNGGSIEYVIQTQDFTSGGDGDGLSIGSVSSDPVRFATANTTALTIDTSQNVGIGTTSPDAKLDIYDNVNRTSIHVQNSNHIAKFEAWGTATAIDTSASNGVFIRNGGTNHVHFDGNGRVGINVTDPSTQFHVSGSGEVIRLQGATGQSYMTFYQGTGGRVGYIGTSGTGMILESSNFLRLYTSGSDAVYITGDNKVGIGNSNPSYPLSVTGAISGSTYYGDASNLTGRIGLATSASHAEYADAATSATSASSVPYSGLTGTVPTWNQNTTGNAATATSASHSEYADNATSATSATSAGSATSASSVPYSGLTGTVPTWNQSTTGNAATATSASHSEYADNATSATSATSATTASYAQTGPFLSSYTETDTLNTVTGRGATTSNGITVGSLTASGTIGNLTAGSLGQQMEKGDASVTTLRFDANRWRLYAGANAGEVLTVAEAGNVGINTTSPSQKLDVNGTALIRNTIYVGDNIQHWGDGGTGIYFDTDQIQLQNDSGTTRLHIGTGGNVGIGTTSPATKLDVNGVLYSRGGTWNGGGSESNYTVVGAVIQEGHFIFTKDGDNLRKLIGKTSDIIEIGQAGTSLIDGISFLSGTTPLYRWYNNTSEIMRLNATGLGIGTTNPSYKLDVNGVSNSTSLYVNGVNQHSGGFLSELAVYQAAYTRSTTSNSSDEWVKVIEYSGSPRRIVLNVLASGDNTNAYDTYLISHSGYGMQTHILRYPGSKYNTSKILAVKVINSTGATQQVWVKLAGVTSSNGTFLYASNVAVQSTTNAQNSSTGTEPSSTTGTSILNVSTSDRNTYTTMASGGGYFGSSLTTAGLLTANGASFTTSINLTAGQVKLRDDVALDHDGNSLYVKAPSTIFFYPGNSNKANINTAGTLQLAGNLDVNGTGTSTIAGSLNVASEISGSNLYLNRGGYLALYGNGNGHHAITSRDASGNASDDLRINSYHNVYVNLDSNNNNTSDTTGFHISQHGGTGTLGSDIFSVRADGLTTINGNAVVNGGATTGNAFSVNRGSDGAQALRVQNAGEVVVSNNYFYAAGSGTSAYFQDTAVFRGAIVNDGGDVRVADNLKVEGNATITGTITAQQFHTEYVSSSILHESGSTSFGNSSDDVHNFTGSLNVQGNISHEGITPTSGTDIDQIKTFSKSLTVTTSWSDTGISGSGAAGLATGTYMLQMHTNNHGVSGGHYNEYYSGVMSWYGSNTNSSDSDEIVLHKAGHAPNSNHIYLKTVRRTSGNGDLKLQIASTATTTGNSTYTFKFRRMI